MPPSHPYLSCHARTLLILITQRVARELKIRFDIYVHIYSSLPFSPVRPPPPPTFHSFHLILLYPKMVCSHWFSKMYERTYSRTHTRTQTLFESHSFFFFFICSHRVQHNIVERQKSRAIEQQQHQRQPRERKWTKVLASSKSYDNFNIFWCNAITLCTRVAAWANIKKKKRE